jgi:hypothetical protein
MGGREEARRAFEESRTPYFTVEPRCSIIAAVGNYTSEVRAPQREVGIKMLRGAAGRLNTLLRSCTKKMRLLYQN